MGPNVVGGGGRSHRAHVGEHRQVRIEQVQSLRQVADRNRRQGTRAAAARSSCRRRCGRAARCARGRARPCRRARRPCARSGPRWPAGRCGCRRRRAGAPRRRRRPHAQPPTLSACSPRCRPALTCARRFMNCAVALSNPLLAKALRPARSRRVLLDLRLDLLAALATQVTLGVAHAPLGSVLFGRDHLLVGRERPAVRAGDTVAQLDDAVDAFEQVAVVADDDEHARPGADRVVEQLAGRTVEVVGRLVEQGDRCTPHQQSRDSGEHCLAAGQRAHRAVEIVRQSEPCQQSRRRVARRPSRRRRRGSSPRTRRRR